MHLFRQIVVAVAGCFAAGCGNDVTFPTGVPTRGAITTDSLGYTARVVGTYNGYDRVELQVIGRFENTTASAILLERCFSTDTRPMAGLRYLGGGSSDGTGGYTPSWACVEASPLVLAPGAIRVDTFTFRGPTAFFTQPTVGPNGPLDGRFRLEYYTAWNCPSIGACAVPDSLRFSNEIAIRVGKP